MKATVTLDEDVQRMLREAARRSRRSFEQTLNDALRAGLAEKSARTKAARFVVKARPMGVRKGIDPAKFNRLADEFEVDAFLVKAGRTRG